MGRTRLRGLEIAGIQIGIEVPESVPWDWPRSPVADYQCLPREPEVHVGVRVGEVGDHDLDGDRYAVGAWTFEVSRRGRDWELGLSRGGRRAQIARFDAEFRAGEVVLSPAQAATRGYPLRGPLGEWILLHRTAARGGLCLNAGIEVRAGRGIVRLGATPERVEGRWTTPSTSLLGREPVFLREQRGMFRIFGSPWNARIEQQLGREARVEEIQRIEPAALAYRERLELDDAAEALVTHAVAPLCDDVLVDRVLRNARRLARSVEVVELGETPERAAPMAWRSSQLQGAFAPPGRGGF